MFKMFSRAASFALLVAAALSFALAPEAAAQQQQNQQQQQAQHAQKKKLQASSNFTQYAGRDASNRLIAGGATRNLTDEAGQLNEKGQEAYEAAKYDDAVAAFRRVTELKPSDARAFYHLGVAYETAGRYREAVAAYRQAAALADRAEIKAVAFYNLGNSFAADNQPKEIGRAHV